MRAQGLSQFHWRAISQQRSWCAASGDNYGHMNLMCGIRVNAVLLTSKITVSCNCVKNCVSVHLNLALRVSDDSTFGVKV